MNKLTGFALNEMRFYADESEDDMLYVSIPAGIRSLAKITLESHDNTQSIPILLDDIDRLVDVLLDAKNELIKRSR